jgi:hypothetical protein
MMKKEEPNIQKIPNCVTPVKIATITRTICTKKVPYFNDDSVGLTEQKVRDVK